MEKLYRWLMLFLELCLITVCKIMLRHFTNKGMESRESKLIIKQCIWLNFIGKGHFFFFFFWVLTQWMFLFFVFCCFVLFFFTSNCQQERKHTTSIDWLWIFNYFSAPTTSDCRASPTTLPETCRRLPTTSDDLLPHLHHNGCWIDDGCCWDVY